METMATGKQLIIERILRDRAGIWDQIIGERDLPRLILRMLLCSAISLAAYGAVLGASNGWLQALVSTVKLPMLFLVTLGCSWSPWRSACRRSTCSTWSSAPGYRSCRPAR
jgi:hypothetical protein